MNALRRIADCNLVSAASIAVLVAVFSGTVGARAQSVEDRLRNCLFVEDDRERLICLEIEALRIVNGRADLDVSSASDKSRDHGAAGDPNSDVAGNAVERPRDNFGLPSREPEMPDELAVVVVEIRERRPGVFALLTEQGQIWETTERRSVRMPSELPAAARIEKGLFGSYFIDFAGPGADIRVRRQK